MSELLRAVVTAQAAARVAASPRARERTWTSPPPVVREWLHRVGRLTPGLRK